MRLRKARVQAYRSIRDTGWFEIEEMKTIMVGPNEAGKTAILQALQRLNPPKGIPGFDPLRDYPRTDYNADIVKGKISPDTFTVVEGHFSLDAADLEGVPEHFKGVAYKLGRRLDNSVWHDLEGGPARVYFSSLKKDLARLVAHLETRIAPLPDGAAAQELLKGLTTVIASYADSTVVSGAKGKSLKAGIEKMLPQVHEGSEEESRYNRIVAAIQLEEERTACLDYLHKRTPVFVLFSNYFRVRPSIHLDHLARRTETNVLDDTQYDYGNNCLLSLLGFTARELSTLGKAADPAAGNAEALKQYRDQLDKRSYQLNAASVRLTSEICSVWVPDSNRAEADRLRVQADGQYLKVVVEDDLGVEIELDQRSEGFQWLVSFFVVFFAETADNHENAILLLDEPGMSLHGLKQREFRNTISRLAEHNQTIYTTHSPFLVGPNELDLVRVVEMVDRKVGTKVHNKLTASDSGALLPLQEALGYDLAQSLFSQQRNLVLEGLTDYWYLEGLAQILRESKDFELNENIAMVPANTAGKVAYFATILHAQKLKVAALLDSDAAGDQAAQQEVLVHVLGNKGILRTKDAYSGSVSEPEIEDLLRTTLVSVAKTELGWDLEAKATSQNARPICDLFIAEVADFSKYKLAKGFLRWARTHGAKDLTPQEKQDAIKLLGLISKALK